MPKTAFVKTADRLEAIICGEFNEMPGMRLTITQVRRLWALSAAQAEAAIRSLVARGALTLDHAGRLCRPQDLHR
jgi:hypothetical protein